jgi:hypothetical protein
MLIGGLYGARLLQGDHMSYRFWLYSREGGKIFEIPDKAMKQDFMDKHPGWYENRNLVPKDDIPLSEVARKAEEEKKKLDSRVDKLVIAPQIVQQVVMLLNGKEVKGKTGLSLTSFGKLYNVKETNYDERKKIKPKYEALLDKLKEEGDIVEHRNRWFYKGKEKTSK